MRTGRNRQSYCRACGSPQLLAVYRSDEVIYLSCQNCTSVWPVETDSSRKQSSAFTACLITDALAVSAATIRRRETRRKAGATTLIASAAARPPRALR